MMTSDQANLSLLIKDCKTILKSDDMQCTETCKNLTLYRRHYSFRWPFSVAHDNLYSIWLNISIVQLFTHCFYGNMNVSDLYFQKGINLLLLSAGWSLWNGCFLQCIVTIWCLIWSFLVEPTQNFFPEP